MWTEGRKHAMKGVKKDIKGKKIAELDGRREENKKRHKRREESRCG